MLVVAPVEEYRLLRRPVAPVRRRVVEGGVTRPGRLPPSRDRRRRVGNESGDFVEDCEREARTERGGDRAREEGG